jgi:hypothetical protein
VARDIRCPPAATRPFSPPEPIRRGHRTCPAVVSAPPAERAVRRSLAPERVWPGPQGSAAPLHNPAAEIPPRGVTLEGRYIDIRSRDRPKRDGLGKTRTNDLRLSGRERRLGMRHSVRRNDIRPAPDSRRPDEGEVGSRRLCPPAPTLSVVHVILQTATARRPLRFAPECLGPLWSNLYCRRMTQLEDERTRAIRRWRSTSCGVR